MGIDILGMYTSFHRVIECSGPDLSAGHAEP
jgi:hypothetical protein